MSSDTAIRGHRIGAGPAGEPERGEAAPRIWVSFWCANQHQIRPSLAADAAIPETWECPRCGNPAGQDEQNPPAPPRDEPFKTHLAYVKERRSDSDSEQILAEALARLHGITSQPAATDPPPARAADGEGRHHRRGHRQTDAEPPEPAPAPPPPPPPPGADARERSHDAHEPAQLDPAADERCEDCGYKLNAPGHAIKCLGR